MEQKTILVAAGGTGGHIFPGLAIAEKLIANGHKVIWIGTQNGLESTLIPKNNIEIYYIKIAGFRGKNLITKILAPFNILVAIWRSLKIIHSLNPNVVLGMGGFVAGPVGIAAWILNKKLIIHEQNSIAGSSNRILAYFADQILESFPNSFPKTCSYKNKISLTGLPIRQNLLNHNSLPPNKDPKILRILVLGGSRGAQFLNQTIPQALGGLSNIKILHQTGEKDFLNTCNLYQKYAQQNIYEIKPFIDNMLDTYLAVDLVICRAGASTVFEIMFMGMPAILIPLPWAIDDHQTKNAQYLVDNNAAILLKQSEATIEKLQKLVVEIQSDKNKIYAIETAVKLLYMQYKEKNSADCIVGSILA